MGDISQLVLDGFCCDMCGEFIDSEGATGYPRTCNCCEDALNEISEVEIEIEVGLDVAFQNTVWET